MKITAPTFLTAREAADSLGLGVEAIRKAIRKGQLKAQMRILSTAYGPRAKHVVTQAALNRWRAGIANGGKTG